MLLYQNRITDPNDHCVAVYIYLLFVCANQPIYRNFIILKFSRSSSLSFCALGLTLRIYSILWAIFFSHDFQIGSKYSGEHTLWNIEIKKINSFADINLQILTGTMIIACLHKLYYFAYMHRILWPIFFHNHFNIFIARELKTATKSTMKKKVQCNLPMPKWPQSAITSLQPIIIIRNKKLATHNRKQRQKQVKICFIKQQTNLKINGLQFMNLKAFDAFSFDFFSHLICLFLFVTTTTVYHNTHTHKKKITI